MTRYYKKKIIKDNEKHFEVRKFKLQASELWVFTQICRMCNRSTQKLPFLWCLIFYLFINVSQWVDQNYFLIIIINSQ